MTTKKYWEKLSLSFLDLHKKVSEKRSIETHDYQFDIFPEVFSPLISSDTIWFAEQILPIVKGKKFLEIGSGSGMIACLAKLKGASIVSATDINPNAVRNIFHNTKKHDLDIKIFQGDVFDPVPIDDKYDVIFWNHPFNYIIGEAKSNDNLFISVFDSKYESLRKYFLEGNDFLKKDGLLLLGTGNIARINLIKEFAKKYGYKMKLLNKKFVALSKFHKTQMDIRIYSFKKRG